MLVKRLYQTLLQLVFLLLLFMFLVSFMVLNNSVEPTQKKEGSKEALIEHAIIKKTDPKFAKGKALFKLNCANCHNKNLTDDLTGPALAGVRARWEDYPEADLYKWIRNSLLMYEEGHPRAKFLIEKYKSPMTSFINLTDAEIEAILYFIDEGVK